MVDILYNTWLSQMFSPQNPPSRKWWSERILVTEQLKWFNMSWSKKEWTFKLLSHVATVLLPWRDTSTVSSDDSWQNILDRIHILGNGHEREKVKNVWIVKREIVSFGGRKFVDSIHCCLLPEWSGHYFFILFLVFLIISFPFIAVLQVITYIFFLCLF